MKLPITKRFLLRLIKSSSFLKKVVLGQPPAPGFGSERGCDGWGEDGRGWKDGRVHPAHLKLL